MEASQTSWFWIGVGWFFTGLAAIGVVLPLLPTTPFLLVAIWAFSKGSARWHHWLRTHKIFGPYIRAWQDHHAIPVRAKVIACVMLSMSAVYIITHDRIPDLGKYSAITLFCCVAIFVLSRPTGKDAERDDP